MAANLGRRAPVKVAPEVLRLIRGERVNAVLRGPPLPEMRDFLQVMQEIEPLLRACVWPRWLLLEAALDDASNSGSLHLSALILRTQIEELDTLRTVAAVLPPTDHSWDDSALASAVSTLRSRVLPRLQTKTAEQLIELASDAAGSGARPASLQMAFDQLSEYVHPNYGSHILSVRPHSVQAASVFVQAFVAIYEAFLSLPWAKEVDDRTEEPKRGVTESRDPHLILADCTIPALAPAFPELGQEIWNEAANCFHRRAELESQNEASFHATEDGEFATKIDVEAIRALREHAAEPAGWPEPLGTAGGRVRYALLAEVQRQLVEDAQLFLPGVSQRDYKAWLSFLLSGLLFSINVTEHKLDTLGKKGAQLLNAKNVLGATPAIRSMLEHHALAIELGTRLQVLWERVERAAPNEDQVFDVLGEAERQIARVLAGTSASCEHSAPWKTLWEQTVRKPYNVLDPIRALDAKEPGFLKAYGLLSHVVHGKVCTGGDLLGTPIRDSGVAEPILAQLAVFLSRLCDLDAMLYRHRQRR